MNSSQRMGRDMNAPPIPHASGYPVQNYPGTSDYIERITDTPVHIDGPGGNNGDINESRKGWVSHVTQIEPAELGPDNDQLFQSGHTSITLVNPANEQGIGRAGRFRWAHYPHVQQFNPTITSETYLLDGGPASAIPVLAPFDSERGRVLRQANLWPEGIANYRQQPSAKHVWPSVASLDQAATVSFTENVPQQDVGTGW